MYIELFSGERPTANASRVRFHNADHLSDATWRNAEAGADAADARGAARHKGIRPIVNVEHERVGSLYEDALARGQRLMYIHHAIDDERAQPVRQHL